MKTWRQAVSGLWTRMRPWTTDHPEPWTGPCVCQGQRRRRAVPLRPPLCSRSLAGKAGVKRRHQSWTGTKEEEKKFLLLQHNSFRGIIYPSHRKASVTPNACMYVWSEVSAVFFSLAALRLFNICIHKHSSSTESPLIWLDMLSFIHWFLILKNMFYSHIKLLSFDM